MVALCAGFGLEVKVEAEARGQSRGRGCKHDWLLQVFSYTKKKSLQADDLCLDVSALGGPVKLYQCHGLGGNQLWEYNHEVNSLTVETNSQQVSRCIAI